MLLTAAVLYFSAGLAVNAWFHSVQYRLYWMADTVFWIGLAAIFLAAARLWAARPYRSLWLAGMFFWLAALQWIRLPYWAVGFGWLALGIYFGCYLPVFVGLSRVGVHLLRLPVVLVAPVVYTGLELAQAHLLSGMTMGCLEHSQYRFMTLIQISDTDWLLRCDLSHHVRCRLPCPNVALRPAGLGVVAVGRRPRVCWRRCSSTATSARPAWRPIRGSRSP